MARQATLRKAIALLAVAYLAPSVSLAFALERTATLPGGPLAGTVVDSAGNPVAGATVWIVSSNWRDSHIVAQATADKQGRFRVAELKWDASAVDGPFPVLIVRDSQHRIGGQVRHLDPRVTSSKPDLRIKLQDVKEYRGRLTDTAGQPIAKAIIRPTSWAQMRSDDGYYQNVFFPAEWDKELSAETGADGTFTIRDVPANGTLFLGIRAEGFGRVRARLNLEKPATFQLARPGGVRGSVTCDKKPDAAAGIRIQIHRSPARSASGARPSEPDSEVYYSESSVTQKDGTFAFEDAPPGTYSLQAQLPDAFPYYVDDRGPVEVKSGAVAIVSLSLLPAVRIQGKVIDQQAGKGLAGVRVALRPSDGRASGGTATTDAQGAFALYSRTGSHTLQLWDVPDPYLNPSSGRQPQTVEVMRDTTLEPIRLRRASGLEGIVVDESGSPVADAEVRYTDFENFRWLHEIRRSDAAGKFSLSGLGAKPISVRARTDKAAGDPVNVKPSEAKGPIRLVVSEKSAFAVRGTIVNDAGAPIRAAQIELITFWSTGGGGVSFRLTAATSDAEGKFQIGGLWPGDEYGVQVSADGYDKGASPRLKGSSGLTHDFGKLLLKGTAGVVEGTVVDSYGKPIADVRVFNCGDASEPIEARSEASGRFRLKGFHAGPVFVFGDKQGYRFTRVRTASGATDVVLKMLRRDEPIPPQPSRPASMSREEEQKLAHLLLQRIWAVGNQGKTATAVSLMARIDPEQARKWSAESGGKHDKMIRRIMAETTAETDLDEAIAVLSEEPRQSYFSLKRLADRLAASHPDKALRLAEEAVLRARGMDQAAKISCLAEVAPLIARLGHEDAARKLVSEAADLAEKMQDSDSNSYVRGKVAGALASYDFSRALSLANKTGNPTDRDRYRAGVVAAAGMGDLDRALAALEGLKPFFADRARLRLAYRLAATRPMDAARIVESMPDSRAFGFPEETKAQMLRWVAAGTAPRDKAEAWKMVDAAFELYLGPSWKHDYSDNRRPTQAAALAVVAGQIGYPDMESVVSRVIATRVTTKYASSPGGVVDSTVAMAMLLALVDPETARQVLAPLEPQSDSVGSGFSGVGRDAWLKAWAVADPKHAMELADRELAKAKDRRDVDLSRSGLFEMVELWTLPADERFRRLAGHLHNLAFPDEE